MVDEIVLNAESQRFTSDYFLNRGETPNEEEFNTKYEEVKKDYPLYKLREERNKLLAQTDWIMLRDVKLENMGEWEIYRQQLRDLPKTQTDLETNIIGNLINVEYPTKPH
tara:strand:+ start:191 stop:520 length:330 start_codon:yes stop_codon:yes gene_type:complete